MGPKPLSVRTWRDNQGQLRSEQLAAAFVASCWIATGERVGLPFLLAVELQY